MFNLKSTKNRTKPALPLTRTLEFLEDRCLLSASHGINTSTITFAQAPAAVQTGIDTLATADSETLPTDITTVYLGNTKGVETYTVNNSDDTRFTVDQNGKVVTDPVKSTTTFGALTNTVVTDEFNALAAALNKNAPASTDNVNVLTNSDGTAVYTMTLSATTTTTTAATKHAKARTYTTTSKTTLSVDSNGDPTGNESVPLSTLNADIQSGLTASAPAGSTALTPTSLVNVKTADGITTYSATYSATGIKTIVTVDDTGTLTSLPSSSTVQFSTIPPAAQAELQTLATADGYVGTIPDTQNIRAYDEANGTVIYSATVKVAGTHNSYTFTFPVTVSSDQDGNPTVPPNDGFGGFFNNIFGDIFGGFGGFFGGGGNSGGCQH